jgi:hypothetical protein
MEDNTYDEDNQIANRLLEKKTLLTPQIKTLFGKVILENRSQTMQGDQLLRQVTLVQEKSNLALLEGRLCINVQNLPKELCGKLTQSKDLFGQLLIDFDIAVKIKNLDLFSMIDADSGYERYGRRHKIVDADTGAVLSEVEELFSPQENLRKARNYFLNGISENV